MSTNWTATRLFLACLRFVLLVFLLSSDPASVVAASSEAPAAKPPISAQVEGVQNGFCNNAVICVVWGTRPTITQSQSGLTPADTVRPSKSDPVTAPPENGQKGKSSGKQRPRPISPARRIVAKADTAVAL
jgi:hypothetical protein